jgi:hypothetical protein
VIPDIQQIIRSLSRRNALQGLVVHLDNAHFMVRNVLQMRLNRQKPNECRGYPMAQTEHQVTSFSLVV